MMRSASVVLDQEFLQMRAKILELAAFFDRLDEARTNGDAIDGDAIDGDAIDTVNQRNLGLLIQGSGILTDGEGDKAARLQLLFSRVYESDWRETFEI